MLHQRAPTTGSCSTPFEGSMNESACHSLQGFVFIVHFTSQQQDGGGACSHGVQSREFGAPPWTVRHGPQGGPGHMLKQTASAAWDEKKELAAAVKKKLKKVFKSVDLDGNGTVSGPT
eukprot:2373773-Amphidinium_carterae.1